MSVQDLTFEEKLALLHQYQPAIERLGLRAFRGGTEALHGLAWAGPATVFPQAIGLASTWNPALLRRVGRVVAAEVRRAFVDGRPGADLEVWAPVVDLLRDPRAGRNEEGYSEDPYLTGVMSTAFCEGLTGEDPDRLLTAPVLKHFLAYGNETDRVTSSSDVRPRLLHEYYLRAFEPAVRSGAAPAVMLAYNLVNGRPNHVSPLVADVLRQWAPDLLVVSDAFAPSNLAGEQGFFASPEEAHAAAMRAGLDRFTDHDDDPVPTVDTLRRAVANGLLDERTIDDAVSRILALRRRLDESGTVPATEPAGPLAREACRQSIVLLRNDGFLPLRPDPESRIAVVGQLADVCLEDWYSGELPYAVTPLDGITERARASNVRVRSTRGTDVVRFRVDGTQYTVEVFDWGEGLSALRDVDNDKYLRIGDAGRLVADRERPAGWVVEETFRLRPDELEHVASGTRLRLEDHTRLVDGPAQAAALASEADVSIVVVGNHPLVGARETADRSTLALPSRQRDMIRAVVEANPRTVLVIVSGFPYVLGPLKHEIPAALWMSHGGQETGRALADVLFGDVSPSGRLTQTWYASEDHLPSIHEYDIITAGTTYLYSTNEPEFSFGHGMSYSEFVYTELTVEPDANAVSFAVTNTGSRRAAEVAQLYVRRVTPSKVDHPRLKLCGFERVELDPGETARVRLGIGPDAFTHWDVRTNRFVVEPGGFEILVGASSTDVRLSDRWDVVGDPLPPRDLRRRTHARDFDAQQGVRLVPASRLAGDAVQGATGGWIGFHDVDVGALAATELVAVVGSDRGEVLVVRLDDPVNGPMLARLYVPRTSGPYAWAEVHTALTTDVERRAVRDLYLVFGGPARIADLWCEGSEPGDVRRPARPGSP